MEEVFFNGVVGRLEGRFHRSESPRAPLVLVLPPNPTQGGAMNNRVVYTLFQAFVDLGFSVLRFNYRGVGHSQGQIDGSGAGELADTIGYRGQSVLDRRVFFRGLDCGTSLDAAAGN